MGSAGPLTQALSGRFCSPMESFSGRFFAANIFRFRWRELATKIVPECY